MARRLPLILFLLLIATAAEASMRSLSSTDINDLPTTQEELPVASAFTDDLPLTVPDLFSGFTSTSSAPGMAPIPSTGGIPSGLKDKSLNELFELFSSEIPSSPDPTSNVLSSVDAGTLTQMASAVNASGLAAAVSTATPAAKMEAAAAAAAPPPVASSGGVSVTVTSVAVFSIAAVGGFAMF